MQWFQGLSVLRVSEKACFDWFGENVEYRCKLEAFGNGNGKYSAEAENDTGQEADNLGFAERVGYQVAFSGLLREPVRPLSLDR